MIFKSLCWTLLFFISFSACFGLDQNLLQKEKEHIVEFIKTVYGSNRQTYTKNKFKKKILILKF